MIKRVQVPSTVGSIFHQQAQGGNKIFFGHIVAFGSAFLNTVFHIKAVTALVFVLDLLTSHCLKKLCALLFQHHLSQGFNVPVTCGLKVILRACIIELFQPLLIKVGNIFIQLKKL